MKTLVIYYSLTGNTQKVAEAIASACDADIEPITETINRRGLIGIFRTFYQTLFSRCSEIHDVNADPAEYDLLVLGTPVWMMKMPPPMRSYICRYKNQFSKLAFFCTEGASGGTGMFKKMAELSTLEPITTLEITEDDIESDTYLKKVEAFTKQFSIAPTAASTEEKADD